MDVSFIKISNKNIICLILIRVSLFLLTSWVCATDNSTDNVVDDKDNDFKADSNAKVLI